MTLETVRSLKAAVVPAGFTHQIVVVDNSPLPDGTLKKALKKFQNIKLITTLKNTGFAHGNNLGIRWGMRHGGDYFLLLNNDVTVHRYFLQHLLKAMTDRVGLAVPKVYFAKGYEYHKERYQPDELGKIIWYAGGQFDWDNVYGKHFGVDEVDRGQYDQQHPVDFANFCCVLIKKEVFDRIGFLNSKYFLYFEDADFSWRAQRHGFIQMYVPKAKIWHKSSGSSGSGSRLHDYYITRNRLVFGMKYARARTKFALLREAVRKMVNGRPGERSGIRDFFLHRLGKGSFI